ncbi:MAG: nucleoside deaminase [Devosia sp.]
MNSSNFLSRLFDVVEFDIVPLTRRRVELGNKIFGAAILRKSDLSLVVAETNNETENPLWHGEMHAIRRFYELPSETRPVAKDCVFVATHEPCSLCLSGITWSGFDNFHYLFDYEDTRDAFDIPHDIRILREVYAVPDPDRNSVPAGRDYYNRSNAFFTSHSMVAAAEDLDDDARADIASRIDRLTEVYATLSARYQADRGRARIPLS